MAEGIYMYMAVNNKVSRNYRLVATSIKDAFRNAEEKIRNTAKQKILKIYNDIALQKFSKEEPFVIGYIEQRMRDYAKANNIHLQDISIWMSSSSLSHARRDSKVQAGIDVPVNEISEFPFNRENMDLYYDNEEKTFVYTDYTNKYVISPSKKIKIKRKNKNYPNFVTASKVTDRTEFGMNKYQRV